jgi:hypothetical protein
MAIPNQFDQRQPGGRRIPRPSHVEACAICEQPRGANYPACQGCYDAVESLWLADWRALLEEENIEPGSADERLLAETVAADIDAYTWTVVDIAHTLLRCPDCGAELPGGPLDCANCKFVFENLWAYDMEAGYQGTMSLNEHMIRVARLELRFSHRFPADIVRGVRWLLPIGLTNPPHPEPHKMQAIYAAFDAGTLDPADVAWENSFDAVYVKVVE